MIVTPRLKKDGDVIVRTTPCVVVLLVAVASQLAAQAEPDFSGRWLLESRSPSASDIPTTLSVRQSLVSTNVRGEPMKPFFKDITVVRELESGVRSDTYLIGVEGGTLPGVRENGSVSGPRHSPSRRMGRTERS